MKLTDIHEDKRGKIMLLTEDMSYPEITIFTTKAGLARGGCIHNISDEYTCVIEGIVEYDLNGEKTILKTGESLFISRGTPHYYRSLTDSVVMEWGANPKEKQKKHLFTRKIVDAINANLNKST
jgi:mannose-6-phosphate isomerase-like protein (cupin superfamily)